MTSGTEPWIRAAEASRLLGVTRETLYAYVSRGYLRSQAVPGRSRERTYSRDDVERLRQRTEQRRAPDKAAARALQWGLPVLESAITLIDGQHLYYRGCDAVRLAGSRSVEEIAALIWTGDIHRPLTLSATPGNRIDRRRSQAPSKIRSGGSFIAQAQALLAAAPLRDPSAFDRRPEALARTGWRIVWLLANVAAGRQRPEATIDGLLCHAWNCGPNGLSIIRAVLILCADHELNVSSFTARCVASADSHLYAVVIAGLAALEGPKHGGASARVEALLASLRRVRGLDGAVAERFRRGESIDGFGHPLYRLGDPRARALLELLRTHYGRSSEYQYVAEFARIVTAATGQKPNVDFALAAVSRVLRLPPGSPLMLFAIGRTIGWIGHALEQYAAGQLIRPRAKYVGVVPRPDQPPQPPRKIVRE